MSSHPGPEDLPYLRSHFVELDGTELVAPDYFELAHLAGGSRRVPAGRDPGAIVAKGELMDTIERLTGDPRPGDDEWRREQIVRLEPASRRGTAQAGDNGTERPCPTTRSCRAGFRHPVTANAAA